MDDAFKCPICFERFNSDGILAYYLKCGHALCLEDACKIRDGNRISNRIKCPMCSVTRKAKFTRAFGLE